MKLSEELISNYLDDTLTGDQEKELNAWLREDSANLKALTLAMVREEQLRAAASERHAPGPTSRKYARSRAFMKWTVAASLVVATTWFTLLRTDAATTLTMVNSSGEVSLRSETGNERRLHTGEPFATGTLLIEGDGARANFAYSDGSTFALSGGSELGLETKVGKRMHLHRGAMAANVLPQPSRQPLIVRTPTAEAKVLGTSFTMNATEMNTLLQVKTGEVKLRRLSDDQTLLVAMNEEVRTGQSADQPLAAKPIAAVSSEWKAKSTANDGTTWKGEWTKEETLIAGPQPTYLKKTDSNEDHYQAGARNNFPGLVTLNKDSAIRIRYRLDSPLNVGLFVSTHNPSWDFTGNFQAYIEDQKTPADKDGWQTATVPMSSFMPLHKKGLPFEPGCIAATIFATTYSNDVGLEIAELKVISTKDDH